MPYSPGVQFDPSALYQGIANLGQGLATGILERRKKEEEKQKKTAALAFARKFMPMVNPDMANVDDKTLGAGIESMGVDNVLSMADHIAKQATAKKEADQRQQLIQQQIAASKADLIAQEQNRRALQQAASPQAGLADQILSGGRFSQLDPNQAADPARSYIRAGGSDPAQMNQLNDMAARMAKGGGKPGPQLMDLGQGVRGVWDGNNFSRIPDPKETKDVAPTADIGGRTLTSFGGKVFDQQTGAIVQPDKPLDPFAGQLLLQNYQAAISQIQNHKKGWTESQTTADNRLAALQEKANYLADQLGNARPFPKIGTAPDKPEQKTPPKRVKQGGIIYEFDGKNYNPIKG